MEDLQIKSLKISNFLIIKDLTITPEGKLICASGMNGNGKTTIIKAILYALTGRSNNMKISEYINNDEQFGGIALDLGDLFIERGLSKGKEDLVVKYKGKFEEDPKSFLKNMLSKVSFNPIDFATSGKREQRDMILRALNVKYTLDQAHKDSILPKGFDSPFDGIDLIADIEDKITKSKNLKKEQIKSLTKDVQDLTKEKIEFEGAKKLVEKCELDDIASFIAGANKQMLETVNEKTKNETSLQELESDRRDRFSLIQEEVASVSSSWREFVAISGGILPKEVESFSISTKKLQELEESFEKESNDFIAQKKKNMEVIEKKFSKKSDEITKNISILEERIEKGKKIIEEKEKEQSQRIDDFSQQKGFELIKEKNDQKEVLEKALEEESALSKRLSKVIKPGLLEKSSLVVKGLELNGKDFYINGVNIHNRSDGQRLLLGVEIAQALSGNIKFILLDGLEKIDPENSKILLNKLKDTEFQYFFTTCQAVPDGMDEVIEMKDGEQVN